MSEFDKFPKPIEADPKTGRVSGHMVSDEELAAHGLRTRLDEARARNSQRPDFDAPADTLVEAD
jgi:hypothetical protein